MFAFKCPQERSLFFIQKAFDFQVDKDEVAEVIKSNLRMEAAPIPYYLFSRYCAGKKGCISLEMLFCCPVIFLL